MKSERPHPALTSYVTLFPTALSHSCHLLHLHHLYHQLLHATSSVTYSYTLLQQITSPLVLHHQLCFFCGWSLITWLVGLNQL